MDQKGELLILKTTKLKISRKFWKKLMKNKNCKNDL